MWLRLFIINNYFLIIFLLIAFTVFLNGFFFLEVRYLDGRCLLISQFLNPVVITSSVLLAIYTLTLFFFFFSDLSVGFYNFVADDYASGYWTTAYPSSLIFTESHLVYVDNTSMLFILLSTLIVPVCIFINTHHEFQSSTFVEEYLFWTSCSTNDCTPGFIVPMWKNLYNRKSLLTTTLLLMLLGVLIIIFSTADIFIFYTCFEVAMLPLYFLIGMHGSRVNKIKASYYLFFFTVLGSSFFLIAVILLSNITGSTNLFVLLQAEFLPKISKIIWICLFIPLSIKVPIFPFHIWLPEAHVEASTEGSVLLAGLLLKLGLFGMIRFLIPIFSHESFLFSKSVFTIALIGIIYISFTMFVQLDVKKIIAYSSIVHMNFALLGLFSSTALGSKGCVYLMFTHGIISSGLFIIIGFLYNRYHTRLIANLSGLSVNLPIFSSCFFILILGNAGIPGTGGFIGEILIILGLFERNPLLGLISLIAPLLGSIISFLTFVRIFYGPAIFPVTGPNFSIWKFSKFSPIALGATQFELSVIILFTVLTIQTGLMPGFYLNC